MSKVKEDAIYIPIFKDDTLFDLIHAFLVDLQERDYIHISNRIEGDTKAQKILSILK